MGRERLPRATLLGVGPRRTALQVSQAGLNPAPLFRSQGFMIFFGGVGIHPRAVTRD